LATAVIAIARAADGLHESVHDHVQGWPRPPELVLLFGSAARADMRTGSDIDLLVVAPPCDEVDAAAADLAAAVTGWTGNDVRIVLLSPRSCGTLSQPVTVSSWNSSPMGRCCGG